MKDTGAGSTFRVTQTRQSKRERVCSECGGRIGVGEDYEHVMQPLGNTRKSHTFSTCEHCLAAWRALGQCGVISGGKEYGALADILSMAANDGRLTVYWHLLRALFARLRVRRTVAAATAINTDGNDGK